jgi:hypothetical protein
MARADSERLALARTYLGEYAHAWAVFEVRNAVKRFPPVARERRLRMCSKQFCPRLPPVAPRVRYVRRSANERVQLEDAPLPVEQIELYLPDLPRMRRGVHRRSRVLVRLGLLRQESGPTVGVWITELPITPERVLRALEAKAEPTREGKKVVFDEELSVNAVSSGGMRFEVPA